MEDLRHLSRSCHAESYHAGSYHAESYHAESHHAEPVPIEKRVCALFNSGDMMRKIAPDWRSVPAPGQQYHAHWLYPRTVIQDLSLLFMNFDPINTERLRGAQTMVPCDGICALVV